MNLLVDENIPYDAVTALRDKGHDVVWIREVARGSADKEVLARAEKEKRILITFDKDFGELAYHSYLPLSCGIILFRIPMRSSSIISKFIVRILESRSDWAGNFAVIEETRIRMRNLPKRNASGPRTST